MLTTEQSHATISYQAFQIQQAAIREAQLVGLVEEREKLISEGGVQLKAAMDQLTKFQATIVAQQATIETTIEAKDRYYALADKAMGDLAAVAKYNGMTVEQMLAECSPISRPGSRIGGDSPAPALTEVVVDDGLIERSEPATAD
ncbi:MAG: hypothetical protein ABI433_17705 [Burkholderiaceae bacterium]